MKGSVTYIVSGNYGLDITLTDPCQFLLFLPYLIYLLANYLFIYFIVYLASYLFINLFIYLFGYLPTKLLVTLCYFKLNITQSWAHRYFKSLNR
jgi:hypothetical protein